MEEASVAGESPDRSKQRESSEEPTSGSAGPVPEARSEVSDPRLAVARAAVDTATRVLSAKELAEARGTDGSGDEKLRAAVAAWVRSGPAEGATDADEADGTDGTDADAADGEDGSTAGVEDSAADADGSAADVETEGAGDGGDEAEGAADAASRQAEADADAAKGAARGGDEADAEGAGGVSADEDTADATSEAEAEVDETEADEADEAEAEADEAEDSPRAEKAAATANASAATAADAADAADAAEDGQEPGGAESEGAADEDEGTEAVAEGGSDDESDAADGERGAGEDAEDEGEAEASAVDQPTAVFKAVRPAEPAVDQPTTMLKIGGAAKKPEGEAEGKAEPEAEKKPAAEAERTSKFVALKPLDAPESRKPRAEAPPAAPAPAPADATAAVPQVGPERTTQQPLPPRPPLDLLAELTNTPPPPQTPLRTAVRRVKIWTPLVLLLVVVFAVVQSMRELPAPTLRLTAEESFIFDGSKVDIPWPQDGQAALDVQGIGSFGSSGEQKPVPIASVAKVMTAYVILRDHPLKSGEEGPKIKIDQAAEDQSQAGQESTVNVFAGDEISEREALESILIASANNVARLLARWDAGSEKDFVAKMNATAEDLGMTNSTYTDPSGLNDSTVSTAVDQVKLAKAAMTQPAFREVAAMMSYDDYKGVNHSNWNQLVGKNGVVGIKTGTTTSALGNLVFAAKKDIDGETRTIVGAVVRQPPGGVDNTILAGALSAGDQLIRAAQDAMEPATIIKKGAVVGYVDDGLGGRTPVVATEDVTAVGWAGLEVKLSFAADELPHTAKAGAKVGTLTVGDGATAGAVKVPVALQRDLVEPSFTDKLTRIG
ncbi:D-alanyl-D-alanine carboxypeptidase [Streptomyces sp. NPDC001595]|uniref:D-alanyl-D-alanine carboxypeptidase n=1 Tax=Streptomyces sp. NPDC001532 TaxID=3154520 RepID=UPI0033285106